jgi:7,8-dihydropterin-6-yl-methyl-4-(beta-D-ribofuranosyl)aminobenzene 5'-phosphate synthase
VIHNLSITALAENTAGKFDLLGGWGLSLWIEADGHRLLCDTGQGRSLMHNARVLGIDVSRADALVLSHGHSDHSGGIAALVDSGFRGKVFANPAALAKRYQLEDSRVRLKGMSAECINALRQDVQFIDSSAPARIGPGLIVTGTIPRRTEFEDTGGAFFLDEACTQPDSLVDDQALLIETPGGWVVITGCGHSGAVNTLNYAAQLTGSRRISAFLGGMHLLAASEERIRATAKALQDFGVRIVAPCHCTGFAATGLLQAELGAAAVALHTGSKLRLSDRSRSLPSPACCRAEIEQG